MRDYVYCLLKRVAWRIIHTDMACTCMCDPWCLHFRVYAGLGYLNLSLGARIIRSRSWYQHAQASRIAV